MLKPTVRLYVQKGQLIYPSQGHSMPVTRTSPVSGCRYSHADRPSGNSPKLAETTGRVSFELFLRYSSNFRIYALQREKIMDGLATWLGPGKVSDILTAVKDRDLWRDMIANAYKQGT
ncbi:hypothetical protein PoB_002844700 [Plakobranchus ocellatus]|uniref:Uncharacterized protein n=1 Tax=Plakobranchus ocellatus TaxID=259542 RepID=A0AAV4A3Q3_9GAST|nr:hypothetical protein PoB_002844700 [Plakobranchus ocellatus]